MKKKKSKILKKTGMAVGAISMGLFLNGISIAPADDLGNINPQDFVESLEDEWQVEVRRDLRQKHQEREAEDVSTDLFDGDFAHSGEFTGVAWS